MNGGNNSLAFILLPTNNGYVVFDKQHGRLALQKSFYPKNQPCWPSGSLIQYDAEKRCFGKKTFNNLVWIEPLWIPQKLSFKKLIWLHELIKICLEELPDALPCPNSFYRLQQSLQLLDQPIAESQVPEFMQSSLDALKVALGNQIGQATLLGQQKFDALIKNIS